MLSEVCDRRLRTTKTSLCQPGERREEIWLQPPCGAGREEREGGGYYQVSSASVHWSGAGRGEGNEKGGGYRFAEGGCFGTMTLVSSGLSLSGEFVGGSFG